MMVIGFSCLFVGLVVGAGLALAVRLSRTWPEGYHEEMLKLTAEVADRLEQINQTLIDTRGAG